MNVNMFTRLTSPSANWMVREKSGSGTTDTILCILRSSLFQRSNTLKLLFSAGELPILTKLGAVKRRPFEHQSKHTAGKFALL